MKNVLYPALFVVFCLSVGCGTSWQSITGGSQPPHAFVLVGSQHIQTVINGYQWSGGNHTSVADAASDPAKNLKKYGVPAGGKATVSFDRKPTSLEVAMWSEGNRVSHMVLNTTSFSLPQTAGDYTYEVTGHWGNDYVNYDFEIDSLG